MHSIRTTMQTKTVLRYLSRWLVAVNGDVDLDDVKNNSLDLDNVVVVSVQKKSYDRYKVITNYIFMNSMSEVSLHYLSIQSSDTLF